MSKEPARKARRRLQGATADERYIQALSSAEKAVKGRDFIALHRQAAQVEALHSIVDSTLRRQVGKRVARIMEIRRAHPASTVRASQTSSHVTVRRIAKANPAKEYRWFVTGRDGTTHRAHPTTPGDLICGEDPKGIRWQGAKGPTDARLCSSCQQEISRMKQAPTAPMGSPEGRITTREELQKRNELLRQALDADLAAQPQQRSVRAVAMNVEGNRRRH